MRKQVVALEDDADVLAQGSQIELWVADAMAADDDLAAVDRLEAVDAAKGSALAGAAAADEDENLAAIDLEADAVEHLERAEALVHVLKATTD